MVDVMPKPETLNPQGQAIERALPSLGFAAVRNARQGKRLALDVDDTEHNAVEKTAATLWANPVNKDFTVRIG